MTGGTLAKEGDWGYGRERDLKEGRELDKEESQETFKEENEEGNLNKDLKKSKYSRRTH